MTDTTTETVTPDNPADQTGGLVATPQESGPMFDAETLDEFGKMAVARLTANIERFNVVTTDLKSLSNDPAEIQKALYESLVKGTVPDGVNVDEKSWSAYLKAKEIVEKVTAYFDTLADETAKKRAAENTDTEKVAVLTTEAETLNKKISQGRKMLAIEYPGAETLLPDTVRKSGSGTSTGTGRGSGGKKLRGFTVDVDGKTATLPNSEGKQASSFAAGAKALGIPTADLQRAYFEAIDATPENYQEKVAALTGPVSLTIPVEGKDHAVVITRNAE